MCPSLNIFKSELYKMRVQQVVYVESILNDNMLSHTLFVPQNINFPSIVETKTNLHNCLL